MALRISSTSGALVVHGRTRPLPDHLRDDPGGELLLAVLPQDAHEIAGGVGVEYVGGGQAGGRVHPHVQRRVDRVGEAAVGAVQLHRRHPEVEQDAVDGGDSEIVEHCGDLVVDGVNGIEAVAVAGGRHPLARQGQRGGVTVDTDDVQPRVPLEHQDGVAGQPEGGVDEDGVVAAERRVEQGRDPIGQHRYVLVDHVGDPLVGSPVLPAGSWMVGWIGGDDAATRTGPHPRRRTWRGGSRSRATPACCGGSRIRTDIRPGAGEVAPGRTFGWRPDCVASCRAGGARCCAAGRAGGAGRAVVLVVPWCWSCRGAGRAVVLVVPGGAVAPDRVVSRSRRSRLPVRRMRLPARPRNGPRRRPPRSPSAGRRR